jgi:hypothetical protein
MATMTRVRDGALARPSEFKGASIARLGASIKGPARPIRALGRQNGYYCARCKRNGASDDERRLGDAGNAQAAAETACRPNSPQKASLIIKSKEFRAF